MKNKSVIMKSFNTHFFDFLKVVSSIIVMNDDINNSIIFFETVKRANPTIIIKFWYTYLYIPYKDVIDNGDLTYFLEKDYKTDVDQFMYSKEIMEGINRIREPIKNMSLENQEYSMEYIQNLSKLSVIYNNLTE